MSQAKLESNIMKEVFLLTTFIVMIIASSASAGPFWREKLTASDGAVNDNFGNSVSISGDVCIVGAYKDDTYTGSAYIFRFDGSNWIEEQKLIASDGQTWDRFGYSVSIDNNLCVIGAYADEIDETSMGSAYIFRYDGSSWVEEQKLTAFDGASSDNFGWSVSISGDVCIVSSPGDDDKGGSSGSVYVFRYNGSVWVYEQKLTASDGASGDRLGMSISICGNVCVIGAPFDDDNGADTGSAYIFRYNGSTWVQEQKMLPPGPGDSWDVFGDSVSIDANVCIVGSSGDNDDGENSGSAYIFRFDDSNWPQEQKLTASDAAEQDAFGESVSVSGNTCVVGAYLDDDNGTTSGSAYLYQFNGCNWLEENKLTAFDGQAYDYFGKSVSIDSGNTIVGAPATYKEDANGAAYTFRPCPTADLSGDCFVNFEDFAVIGQQWLIGENLN